MGAFHTFLGVDLGGGKGKHTAVARLVSTASGVQVVDYGTGKATPWYDDQLIAYLAAHADGAVLAIDAPLTLTSCVRCRQPVCPGADVCADPAVRWFRERANGAQVPGRKPKYTPYTQRAPEVLLQEEHQILPRETLGQGMGPLTARAAHLRRALAPRYRLDENLIEVYPKATIMKLFPARASKYKRSTESPRIRLAILTDLTDLEFAPGNWREDALANDHKFDAIICAYTAYLWCRGLCEAPRSGVPDEEGWIWFPRVTADDPGR